MNLLASFAEFELEIIRERVVAGMGEPAHRGLCVELFPDAGEVDMADSPGAHRVGVAIQRPWGHLGFLYSRQTRINEDQIR